MANLGQASWLAESVAVTVSSARGPEFGPASGAGWPGPGSVGCCPPAWPGCGFRWRFPCLWRFAGHRRPGSRASWRPGNRRPRADPFRRRPRPVSSYHTSRSNRRCPGPFGPSKARAAGKAWLDLGGDLLRLMRSCWSFNSRYRSEIWFRRLLMWPANSSLVLSSSSVRPAWASRRGEFLLRLGGGFEGDDTLGQRGVPLLCGLETGAAWAAAFSNCLSQALARVIFSCSWLVRLRVGLWANWRSSWSTSRNSAMAFSIV